MKFVKKAAAAAIAASMMFSSACSDKSPENSSNTDANNQQQSQELNENNDENQSENNNENDSKDIQKSNAITDAVIKLVTLKSFKSKTYLDRTLEDKANNQSTNDIVVMDMIINTKPFKLKAETTLGGEGVPEKAETYIIEEENKYMTYAEVEGKWYKQEVPQNYIDFLLSSYDVRQSFAIYSAASQNITEAGEEEVNGVACKKYIATIPSEVLPNVMLVSGALNPMGLYYITPEEFKDAPDLEITYWISKDNGYPIEYMFDASEIVSTVLNNSYKSYSGQSDDFTVSVSKYVFDVICSDFDNADEVTLPDDAKNAELIEAPETPSQEGNQIEPQLEPKN